jgi:hypothetical protein
MRVKCIRCKKIITNKSAYVMVLRHLGNDKVYRDVVRPSDLDGNSIALHMNGDRLCGNTASSFRADIIETLGISNDFDLSSILLA